MKTLLTLGLVLLVAGTIGAFALPVLRCRDCGGKSSEWKGPPRPENPVWIGCARCLNRGRITLANRGLRRPLPAPATSLVAHTPPEDDFVQRISCILWPSGETQPSGWSGQVRLVQADDRTYVVMAVTQTMIVRPGTYRVGLILFNTNGQVVHRLAESCSTRSGGLVLELVEPSEGDVIARITRYEGLENEASKTVQELTVRGGEIRVVPPNGP